MEIKSNGIIDGKILDKFGKRGMEQRFGMPTYSLPFEILNAPKGTKSFVAIFDDPDSENVCGFVWIHWLVANLHKTKVEENESQDAYDFLQGMNSWHDNSYGGPCPPDAPHKYRFRVFALSCDLNLVGGYDISTLQKAMQGKILGEAQLFGVYDN